MPGTGTTTLDFGAFPGASDASVVVTGQAGIVSGSLVEAWIRPEATADHTADEHMLETIKVFAGNIVAGTGFTIYGFNTSEINQFPPPQLQQNQSAVLGRLGGFSGNIAEPKGTLIYGLWTIAWAWN